LLLHPLTYRTADDADLDLLESEFSGDLWQRLSRWRELSCTRPSWITLVLSHGAVLEALALLTHPAYGIPLELIRLVRQKTGAPIDAGLLRSGIQCAKKHGAKELFYSIPKDASDAGLLGNFGFLRWREVCGYNRTGAMEYWSNGVTEWWNSNTPVLQHANTPSLDASPNKISRVLSITAAGTFTRKQIVSLIEQSSESCGDSQTKYFCRSLGRSGDAELTLQIMELAPHDPGWWLVALAPGGQQVGLVLPVLNYGELTIGYIGIIPEFRGQGIASYLLSQLHPIVNRSGYTAIYAEVDKANRSMQRTLAKSGFRLESEKQEWVLVI
jgi:ribosomal protein S18 acetylase RimI-like enzyme